MMLTNQQFSLCISDKNGSILSFHNGKKEFIHTGGENRPLFTIRFRNNQGETVDITALEFTTFRIERAQTGDMDSLAMYYSSAEKLPVTVKVAVQCPLNKTFTYWKLTVHNESDLYIDWIDFPDIVVPDDLIASGGEARVFWPAMEGCLVEDAGLRDRTWLKYGSVGYPSKGWEGYYPGPCPMQFMAYYDKNGGLYLGAHDDACNVKAIEYHRQEDGIRLEYRLFPGGVQSGAYEMQYPMVLGIFEGDWHDAAEIYRQWVDKSALSKPLKLYENDKLPEWIKESPVVVTYPVRGVKDTGDMTPNEYYPYTNAIPHINRLSEELDSKMLALLMHWEGTAPWAPPYVWPPYGGEAILRDFVDALHERGNLAGVYCSGIGWTNESVLVPEYSRKAQFQEENLEAVMCAAPDGSVPNSLICNGPIRWGHDMCPSNEVVGDIVVNEIKKIVKSGCDYIQYFDQNLGGASYFCYSRNHGHPPAPGQWQVDAMRSIMQRLTDVVEQGGTQTVIGCESAAAEPYLPYLMFNDLRFNINYFYAKPVPAYAYVFHEYINNFMGNQNSSCAAISMEKSPDNLLFRTAYSFAAGDMLTVVLKNQGEIHWDWCTPWDVPKVDQQSIKMLIRNLNAWRRGAAKPFLCFGRMEKPYTLTGTYEKELVLNSGEKHLYPSLLTSRWISPEGKEAQIVVNYSMDVQEFGLESESLSGRELKVYYQPEGNNCDTVICSEVNKLSVPPLSAIMFEI